MICTNKLVDLEVVGQDSLVPRTNRVLLPVSVHHAAARSIQKLRLRGFVPTAFVKELYRASAASITSLNVGVIGRPKTYEDERHEHNFLVYVGPRGLLWFHGDLTISFTSLTQVLLCERGAFDCNQYNGDEEDYFDFEKYEDRADDVLELEQWASLLRSVRASIVDIVLEQRPIHDEHHIDNRKSSVSVWHNTRFDTSQHSFDSRFYQHVLKPVVDGGEDWPKLETLTLRGISVNGMKDETGERLEDFATRVLPDVEVKATSGNYMFFNSWVGAIMNRCGVDGLRPQHDLWYHPGLYEDLINEFDLRPVQY